MMVSEIDQKVNRKIPLVIVAAVSSLVTSWFFHTPELSKKADRLEVVERTDLPKLQAEKKLAVAAAKCEHKIAEKNTIVAVQAIVSNQVASVPTPTASDVSVDSCPPPTVPPVPKKPAKP